MADKQFLTEMIKYLMGCYPNYDPLMEDDGLITLKVFMDVLGDLDNKTIRAAIIKLAAREGGFAPSVGVIRQECLRMLLRQTGMPTMDEAYHEVINMNETMENVYLEEDTNTIVHQKLGWSHPMVGIVARRIGWGKTFPSDNPVADRAQFAKFYEAALENNVKAMLDPPEVRKYISGGKPRTIQELLPGKVKHE